MGVSAALPDDAWNRAVPGGGVDPGKAPSRLRAAGRVADRLIAGLFALILFVQSAGADTLRVALWHEALSRQGPGLLLRDLRRGDATADAMADALRDADADIVVLTKVDFDASGRALQTFAERIGGYPHVLPLRSNTGVPTGIDLNGDGDRAGPEDAQSYGWFPGQGGLAVLSRFEIEIAGLTGYTEQLWKDLPGTHMVPSDPGYAVQRLSSGGHWLVPVRIGDSVLTVLIGHAITPVFDGPEDRNGRRNLDELRLWQQIIGGLSGPFLFAANTNLDPDRGEGDRHAMAAFLEMPAVQDPLPGVPTAYWERPGPMRVSYLLPSAGLGIVEARVWPVRPGMRHSLITVDIALPHPAQP